MNFSKSFRVPQILISAIFFILVAEMAYCGKSYPYKELFDELKTDRWTVTRNYSGIPVSVEEEMFENNWLQISIPSTATGNPFWGGITGYSEESPSHYFFIEENSAFTVLVNVNLFAWPYPANGVRVGLTVFIEDGLLNDVWHQYTIGRMSHPSYKTGTTEFCASNPTDPTCTGDVFFTNLDNETAYSGLLEFGLEIFRITRDDGTLYMELSWVNLQDHTPHPIAQVNSSPSGKAIVQLVAWGHDWQFSKKDVLVAFDNLNIVSEKGFIIPQGDLEVTVEPEKAARHGGWKMDGKPRNRWLKSGNDSLVSMHTWTEDHVVSFKDIVGWRTPENMTVAIQSGGDEPQKITATYIEQGAVSVVITPDEANTAGAGWKVVGGTGGWNASGALVNLDAGRRYNITFKPVKGWTKPKNQAVRIRGQKTIMIEAAYTKK